MNAITARTELAFDTDTRRSTPAFTPALARMGAARGTPRVGRLAAAVRWLIEFPRRRAVINELLALSDHELADIGLNRGDVVHLFDRGVAGRRNVA